MPSSEPLSPIRCSQKVPALISWASPYIRKQRTRVPPVLTKVDPHQRSLLRMLGFHCGKHQAHQKALFFAASASLVRRLACLRREFENTGKCREREKCVRQSSRMRSVRLPKKHTAREREISASATPPSQILTRPFNRLRGTQMRPRQPIP